MTSSLGFLKRLAGLTLVLPALALAQTVTVSINAGSTIRTVDERVFGINAVIWDRLAADTQTIGLLQQAGIRAIRIPGGSLSDEYHWRLNKGIDKANNNQLNTWTWFTGLDGFTRLIMDLNAQAFVTVNYGSGTPEEAAAWVAYANAATTSTVPIGTAAGYDWQNAGTWANLRNSAPLATDDGMNFLRVRRSAPYGLKYWEIGNECYGANWETDLNSPSHDPTTYANRAKLYIEKMKAVDPTIKIGVVVTASETDYANGYTKSVTNKRTGVTRTGWTPVMLARLKELGVTPDMVVYHRYEQAPAADQPNNPETDAGLLQKAKTWPDDVAAIRGMVDDYLGATGVEIVVTENNSVYAKTGKQTTSLVNGLFLADSVANVMRTEINALMWWDTRNGTDFANNNSSSLYGWRNYGDYGILSSQAAGGPATSYEPYPTYYSMKLLSRFARQGDNVVSATSNNSLLSVFAVKTTAGLVNLLVINKDPVNSLTASIALAGHTPPVAAFVYSYGKPQDDAARTGSGSTDIAGTTMAISGTTFSATFASYSLTVISLDPTATPPAPANPPPAPAPTPTPAPSSGGGGGGAPSLWFVGVLALLALARKAIRR